MSYQYSDQTREHAFDDIQEFDNKLPNWWLWSFYLAVIFAFFYWVHYQVLGTGPSSAQELQQEMEAASATLARQLEKMPLSDETLQKMASDPVAVQKGKELFLQNCVACHGPAGGGGIGPNLTDKFWIRGGKPLQIHTTISKGSPDLTKGMIAWEPLMGPLRTQQLSAFVLSLRNTNIAGGKAPEGTEAQ